MRPERPPPLASPATLRAWSVQHELTPYLEQVFRRMPAVRSVYCCVAQYWADEADDAVHDLFVFSAQDTPAWPHVCRDTRDGAPVADLLRDGDVCTQCVWDFDELTTDRVAYVSRDPKTGREVSHLEAIRCEWHDNSDAIRPWQAFCVEGDQNVDVAGNYAAVLQARRTDTGFTLRFLGALMRPWLDLPSSAPPAWTPHVPRGDEVPAALELPAAWAPSLAAIHARPLDEGPRRVFADWLQQQGDPYGVFLAQSLLAPESEALEAARVHAWLLHGERWLGRLASALSPPAVDFARGVPRGAILHWEPGRPALDALMADAAWRTFEWLHFSPEGQAVWFPSFVSLTEVSGLGRSADVELFADLGQARHVGVSLGAAEILAPLLDHAAPPESLGLWVPARKDWGPVLDRALDELRGAAIGSRLRTLELWLPPAAAADVTRVLARLQRDWPTLQRRTVGTWEPTSMLPAGPRLDDVRGHAKASFLADFTRHRLPPPWLGADEDPE